MDHAAVTPHAVHFSSNLKKGCKKFVCPCECESQTRGVVVLLPSPLLLLLLLLFPDHHFLYFALARLLFFF